MWTLLLPSLLIGCLGGVFLFLRICSPTPRRPTSSELEYEDLRTGRTHPFPRLSDPARCYLSVIIPAFNETQRLGRMLTDSLDYLEKRLSKNPKFSYEIIVVDDGSRDQTTQLAKECGQKFLKSRDKRNDDRRDFRVMSFQKNRGKGGAVTQGILASSGVLMLFADADGASKFSDLEKLEKALNLSSESKCSIQDMQPQVAIGSRAQMLKSEAVVKRSFIRNILMRAFHLLLYILGIASIRDTQCGFKCFTRSAASLIFPKMHVEGWIFDVEVLLLAQFHAIPIHEIPIDWHEVDGTKLNLVQDSILMLKDLILIRLNYLVGNWRI